MKKWLPMLLIGLPLVWLFFYTWAWMARVGCKATPLGECIVSAFGNWGADAVMLRWVDTTLGAGFLAVVAASAVLLNSRIERQAAARDEERRQHAALRAGIRRLRGSLRHATMALVAATNDAAVERTLEKIEEEIMTISPLAPELASKIAYLTGLVRVNMVGATVAGLENMNPYKLGAVALCDAAFAFLSDPERVIANHQSRPMIKNDYKTRMHWDKISEMNRNYIENDLVEFVS